MSLASTISAMVAAGCTPQQIEAVVISHEADQKQRLADKRAKDAERQRKSRMSRNVTVTERDSHGQSVTASRDIQNAPTHAEPEPNKTTYPTTSEANASSVEPHPVAKPKSADAKCVVELGRVLDDERARAVVEHRNRLRKPMTPRAAALLAERFAAAPDPNAAADLMIERGWQGYRPDWGRNDRAPPHRQAKNGTSFLDGLDQFERLSSPNVQHFPRIAN